MSRSTLSKEGKNCRDVKDVSFGGFPEGNEALKSVYDKMHSKGSKAWFSDGGNERKLILEMGEPWGYKYVLEIGCGEGDLCQMIRNRGTFPLGIDYSEEAISRGRAKYQDLNLSVCNYTNYHPVKLNDRLVLQGVLEHLDDPFIELKWMMDNLLTDNGDVITSSPCFLNPRGIVWMALNMVGAVMSKTDLHYLNPWDFQSFCSKHGYGLSVSLTDESWGSGKECIQDLSQRIPLALKDGKLIGDVETFMVWLERVLPYINGQGATAVYRITK